jgi:hypothetical protein
MGIFGPNLLSGPFRSLDKWAANSKGKAHLGCNELMR